MSNETLTPMPDAAAAATVADLLVAHTQTYTVRRCAPNPKGATRTTRTSMRTNALLHNLIGRLAIGRGRRHAAREHPNIIQNCAAVRRTPP